ncbi:hypothetical protein C8J55DRAFT_490188 [Lentinula edodes]|uniref:Uncharacterized protein n=1 Tax=Lentinula lateritia TaxID=40482 RepID=A0A9W9A910_9AGAR|nr:hypothetical protein C8J55DRAFT_490188 [Lentinula edodes]
MDLEFEGVKVDMHRCPAQHQFTLNAYRDVLALLNTIQPLSLLSAFSTVHCSLKLFSTAQGLIGAAPSRAPNFRYVSQLGLGSAGSLVGVRRYSFRPVADSGLGSIMVVLSIERPLSNLIFHASRNSVEVMRRALQRADNMLDEGQSRTDELLKESAVIGWLESRIASFWVQSCTAVASINARFWPIRFTDPGIVDVDNSASPAKSFTALTRFDTKLQNETTRANLDKNMGLANIIPDPFIWSDDGYDSADDDDDGIEDSIPREDQSEISTTWSRDSEVVSALQRKKATAASKANETTHIPAPTKSRTSADDLVIGKHGGDENAVGYEDRFLGIKDWRLNMKPFAELFILQAGFRRRNNVE